MSTATPPSARPRSSRELARRTIRRADLVAAENAFIDCRTPGSEKKLNYAIIGSGVSETDQYVNLDEPHGFQLGGASMPPGVNNSLHLHFTAEVFIVVAGTYTFRWGRARSKASTSAAPATSCRYRRGSSAASATSAARTTSSSPSSDVTRPAD